jgi:predicted nucleic acid-binding Zn ribbon protein
LCNFFWGGGAEGLNAKGIHKEMFPVYGVKCLSCKTVHDWVKKCGKRFTDDEEVETELQKWLRQQSKDFHAAGFDTRVKQWDKCISVDGGYVKK